ncbi:thioredoxin [Curtobacterium sp. ISL-83]|uniref:thioredoxin n=1 Tax=Curtobacterium sp. ISL-83 TaxID=2819145 RepID=UPI001BEA9ABD|nr:thioredoxin [Curtobacterium sp. ISL-83]MBT2502854.1 thioredoxin [Curtobacterium sp. ISL-83]
MSTVTITEENLQQEVEKGGMLLLDFWAAWCGPCRAFSPIYEQLSETNPDITFGKVDTEAAPALASAAGISAIPTLMAFRDGVMVFSQAGALPKPALEDLIAQLRALDMDAVRASLAEHDDHAAHDHAMHDDA